MSSSAYTDLTRIIDGTEHVLLDFDGPICSIFAGRPAQSVAAELRGLLLAEGVSLPAQVVDADDPLEVLRFTSSLGPDLVAQVDAALRAAELVAAQSARPTPHARETILACRQTDRTVGVVSNNSSAAVEAYRRPTICSPASSWSSGVPTPIRRS